MADECTDVMTVEELSVFCRWEEDGLLVEHLEIVHLQQADAESIHSALECLKKKSSDRKDPGDGIGVQARMKKLAQYAFFVHCHCQY